MGQTPRLTSAQTNCAGKKQTPRQRPFWGARLLVERKASASDRFIFRNSLRAFVLVVGGFFGAPSHAENLAWPGSLGTFGTPGLIDMPTAIVPLRTVSIAYSTWYSLPSGENTVIALS